MHDKDKDGCCMDVLTMTSQPAIRPYLTVYGRHFDGMIWG